MTIRYSSGLSLYVANTGSFKAAFANGAIYVISGVQPGSADTGAAGTVLGLVTLNGDPWTPGSPTNGLNLADALIDGALVKQSKVGAETWQLLGDVAGTPGFARFVANPADDISQASQSARRIDMPITLSGGVFNLNTPNVEVGVKYTIDSFVLTYPVDNT